MRMNAVLSNPKHPEYGQFTVPLPIPSDQYDGIMEALNTMGIGDPLARDCQMDEILGEYPILKRLEGKPVNIDELDYLVKRLDSFCYAQEGAQFQGAAVCYDYSDMTDLINLTFSCQQVTVITDFSDLDRVGKEHYMVLNGGCASKEELDNLDGYETALLLIDEGSGVVTPYGVVYDNGMQLSQLYDGRHFPQYFYEPPLLVLTIQECQDAPKTWLYLPAPDLQIKRSMVRAGINDPANMRLSFQGSEFPDAIDSVLDMESESLEELNKLCRAIHSLSTSDLKKLGAVVEYAQPEIAEQIRHLAENLEQFDYAPGVQNVEEYGRYMIQESGRFEYDENLRDFYDYARYGLERMNAEEGRVVKSGYVSYHGVLTLEELMADDSVEQHQAEIDFQMGVNRSMNTKIHYLYRDANNYKVQNSCVIKGVLTPDQINVILGCCDAGEYFIPNQVGLPERKFENFEPQADHCWFELTRDDFEYTDQPANVSLTAQQLTDHFIASKDSWNDCEIAEQSDQNITDFHIKM